MSRYIPHAARLVVRINQVDALRLSLETDQARDLVRAAKEATRVLDLCQRDLADLLIAALRHEIQCHRESL